MSSDGTRIEIHNLEILQRLGPGQGHIRLATLERPRQTNLHAVQSHALTFVNGDGPGELQRQLLPGHESARRAHLVRPRVVFHGHLGAVHEPNYGQMVALGIEPDHGAARAIHQTVRHVQIFDQHDLSVRLERELLPGRTQRREELVQMRGVLVAERVRVDRSELAFRVRQRLELPGIDEVHVVLVRAQPGWADTLVGEHQVLVRLKDGDGAWGAPTESDLFE